MNQAVPYRINHAVGMTGEQIAVEHLQAQGYRILERNWRCRAGEIDIVASTHGQVVICEVKTRRSERFGAPHEAVTQQKAKRLRSLAAQWMSAHDAQATRVRIDVIGVLMPAGAPARLTHLKGVS